MEYVNNGLYIQDINKEHSMLRDFLGTTLKQYAGINRFFYPFFSEDEDEDFNRTYWKVHYSEPDADNMKQLYFFINDKNNAKKYIDMCKSRGISMRFLFVQSTYKDEIWNGNVPEGKFLGYEVDELASDPYTLMDLFGLNNADLYRKYVARLNEYALFETEEDAVAFKQEYERDLAEGLIGDGDVDLYICKLYEISESEIEKVL